MNKELVIVESPAKAKTLAKILGHKFTIMASMGHVRDLPKSSLGVDVAKDFTPQYVVPREKGKTARELKKAAKDAKVIYLATDPDREGEAIAWHLAQVIQSDHKPYWRVVFHEITDEAVKEAFQHPHEINERLVDAQQARRILDRLVGYKISPLLWKKVRRGLSAGRVQSVAVKIIIDREREIQQFVAKEYWVIEAELTSKTKKEAFRATLVGLIDGKKLEVRNETEAKELQDILEKADYSVLKVTTKKVTRQPAPPFITSTLQQEAARKLRFTAKQTMAIAQQLYEGLPVGGEGSVGLITYMRTDSTRVATSAVAEAREFIESKYGKEYVPAHARAFAGKVKGAQEAHEAIRPTRISREPAQIKQYLNAAQFKLYDLIWKRMVASQMSAALFDSTTVDIEAKNNKSYLFRTSTLVNTFPGFIILYTESKDEAEVEEKESTLPKLKKDDILKLLGLFPEQRFTQPPPRYSEASLVKALEQYGIGRPSTYAPILSTIQDREYVTKVSGFFQPTELGTVVNDLLTRYFPNIVDVTFTAEMEDELDDIATSKREWVKVIRDFYTPFDTSLQKAVQVIERVKLADQLVEETCPKCGKPLAIKMGRFGKFLACTGFPECKFTKPFQLKTGVKCPEPGCGGDIVGRMSKKKRMFYGCSNYPKCKFLINNKPLPQPCPGCGGMLVQWGKQAKCLKCNYKGKLPQE
ncbi:MAG: type I DNA topoisomerase [Dehalococcoidales bacterium]|nr:type I DNA topoisomerase [Dehalococcoidales bacterium]